MSDSVHKKILVISIAIIVSLSAFSLFIYRSQQSHGDNSGDGHLDNIEKAIESVVMLKGITGGEIRSRSTGFIIEHNGGLFVVTCAHCVIADFESGSLYDRIVCTFHGSSQEYELNVVKYVTKHDLALLEFVDDVNAPALKIGDSSKLRPGQYVYTLGHPFGLSFFSGSIAFVHTMYEIMVYPTDLGIYSGPIVLIDEPIHSGNSGGPLLSENNEVVGIIFAKVVSHSNHAIRGGYAVPSSLLLELLETV